VDFQRGVAVPEMKGGLRMVDYESALAVAQLTQEEVDAIALHEGLTSTAALELGNYLCTTPDGERALKQIILDDLEHFRRAGNHAQAAKLRLVLRQFVETHPRAQRADG
jgi:hypothetical protein